MAQLVLTAASSVASAGPGIGAILARTVASTAAAYAAGVAERLVFGPRKRKFTGPRLDTFQVQASTEGAGVLRVYGRARVAGQVIWAANFRETVSTTTERSGKGGRLGTKTTTTEYLYSISFAVGLCEGVIDRVARVWADGKPFDLSPHNVRIHKGSETQAPDPAIEAIEGAGMAPAFRGLAYIVFEELPLKEFGNRIPQLSFEIEKSLRDEDPEALENAVTAITMIPGSGEFALGTTKVFRETGEGASLSENVHNNDGVADFVSSLDALEAVCPNLQSVSLVVSWFGTDLRAGACEIRPGVETATKTTTPYEWKAGGVTRAGAHLVSLHNNAPAYGGTPADRSVVEAIAAMKARGLEVMFHPFILMDIPAGNALPDPYGGAEQAAYPWRGRMTVGANDRTAAAAVDIAAFFGSAAPADFSIAGGEVVYSGPDQWSLRRFILHNAHLSQLAGGVSRFLIGSELRGITTARSSASVFPAVAALKSLAADVRAIVGPATKISYAADWSEYFGHQPADGSGDVFFHLDPLWADPAIDFVGVDNYVPLADWRDGFAHLDAEAGFAGPHDRAYLKANVEGGEGYDWFYAGPADRDAQTRTPISDGAYDEAWVYRYKDFRGWWASAHHDRPGGVRSPAPTAWIPESKPILFTETGAPAVDKAANQPNVFVDAKSAETALPHYSSGARDDLAQRRAIEAGLSYWRDGANNPVSSVYGGPMIEAERSHIYAYDARPFPFFPALAGLWGDAANWERGHWLNGRLGRAPLDLLVGALASYAGAGGVDAGALKGVVSGYVVDRPLSGREAIDPLADIFQFDMVEAAAGLRFQPRRAEPDFILAARDLAARDDGALSVSFAQGADLPAAFRLGFLDEHADYQPAIAEARDPGAVHVREIALEAPLVTSDAEAGARARAILADAHLMRETATFSLPPSMLEAEPGDVVWLDEGGAPRRWRLTEIVDAGERRVEAARVEPSVYEAPIGAETFRAPAVNAVHAAPLWALLDLPLLASETPGSAALAAFAEPWPGAVALYREGAGGPVFAGRAEARATMGRLDAPLPPAGSGRWDWRSLRVKLAFGSFSSKSEAEIFDGANALAVETSGGSEIVQFRDAVLGEDGVWTLASLLRGQAGTEDMAGLGAEAGARVVLLNAALTEISWPLDRRGAAQIFQVGPASEFPDSDSFSERSLMLAARGLSPLAPVQLTAKAEAGGLRLAWVRRSRIGGDGWEGEAPLGETFERYRIAIFDGAALKRAFDAAPPFDADPHGRPNALYTDADMLADFGAGGLAGASDPYFTVAQYSDRVGTGIAGRGEL
jgi:hypothetical protein